MSHPASLSLKITTLLLTGLLAACADRPLAPAVPAVPVTAAAEAPAPVPPEFIQCLADLQPLALAAGISENSWATYTRDLHPDASVLARLDSQPEFKLPIWDYLSGLVDEERIALGREKLTQHRELLAAISQRYGVPAEAVVAIWGIESNFGETVGSNALPTALATLSCAGRRQAFFRGELFATLRILQAGDIQPERLRGSWAGAFGQTQFMPSTFERLAVDFDGDGRRDLIDNTADALASAANFLASSRWQRGLPWGFEVKLPAGFDSSNESRRNKQPLSRWSERGLLRVDGLPLLLAEVEAADITVPPSLTPDSMAGLLLPAGAQGPAFLVLQNFDAFYRYNAAESYGLAIAHLSDRLRGGSAFVTPWPTDDPPLSRAERRELQTLLLQRGHEIGAVDGRLGERSRAAIRLEQERLGHPVSGRGGQKLLLALRPQ